MCVCVLRIVLKLCRAILGVWRATGGPQEGDTQHEKGLGGSWEWSHSHTSQPQHNHSHSHSPCHNTAITQPQHSQLCLWLFLMLLWWWW